MFKNKFVLIGLVVVLLAATAGGTWFVMRGSNEPAAEAEAAAQRQREAEEAAKASNSGSDAEEAEEEEEGEHQLTHGSALGIQVGTVVPTFDEFERFLLRNARVHHFAEWWEQYVENTVMGADWESYRRVMCLVGSLLRRLGRRPQDVESDRWRERYMWTRIKEHLAKNSEGQARRAIGANGGEKGVGGNANGKKE